MTAIKNIAVAGGTGELGNAIITALVAAGYSLTILSRTKGKLPADLTSQGSVKEIAVDYASPSSLDSALSGIDAVISTIGLNTLEPQKALWNAAERAGVSRFLPSEYGSELDNPIARALPVFSQKIALQDFIIERVGSGQSKMSYTFVYNSVFLDWGIQKGFLIDVPGRQMTVYDGGDFAFSVSRLSTIAKAVVGVLKNPEETKNRVVRLHDGRMSGNQLLAWAKGVTPAKDWTVKDESSEELAKKSQEALYKGVMDPWVWFGFLPRGSMSEAAGSGFLKTDNELLGIKVLSEAELKREVEAVVKGVLRTSEGGQ